MIGAMRSKLLLLTATIVIVQGVRADEIHLCR